MSSQEHDKHWTQYGAVATGTTLEAHGPLDFPHTLPLFETTVFGLTTLVGPGSFPFQGVSGAGV